MNFVSVCSYLARRQRQHLGVVNVETATRTVGVSMHQSLNLVTMLLPVKLLSALQSSGTFIILKFGPVLLNFDYVGYVIFGAAGRERRPNIIIHLNRRSFLLLHFVHGR